MKGSPWITDSMAYKSSWAHFYMQNLFYSSLIDVASDITATTWDMPPCTISAPSSRQEWNYAGSQTWVASTSLSTSLSSDACTFHDLLQYVQWHQAWVNLVHISKFQFLLTFPLLHFHFPQWFFQTNFLLTLFFDHLCLHFPKFLCITNSRASFRTASTLTLSSLRITFPSYCWKSQKCQS